MNTKTRDEESIFKVACRIPSNDARNDYLMQVCGDDSELLVRLQSMLGLYFQDPSFLEEPAAEQPNTLDFQSAASQVGSQIGPYKLREQIGEGGMGVVYVAEQTEPVKRKVAIKIIKPGMASKDVIARFEAEQQALAMMDHPNIAKVHDGGATDSGQPYFVMELVRGLSITEFCDEHKLSTEDRLKLFATVCRAVQHAHQKGIIHRDLKPSNIIVSEIDDAAVPKVIDFGVAKAVSQTLTEGTVYTQFSQIIGTPLYMSPEQTGLGVVDIDTRSDVYSLGVLLYELLTGNTPFDSDKLKSAGFDEMRRIIREDQPLKPSAMVSTLKAEALSTVSQRRGSDPRRLSENLSGELDWLVMKALEKDRNRRYESASALAADVDRYLADEPVEACPPSIAYRFHKYAQRNKGRLIATALAAAVLLIGIGITINAQVQQVRQQRAIEQYVEQSLAEARTAIETGDLAVAQQRVSEAEGRITAAREQIHDLAGRVNALSTEVSERREQVQRLERFEHLARDAMDRSFSGSGDGDALLRKALSTYDVLDDERWFDKVESSYLSARQQDRLRQTAYETLLVLADLGERWQRNDTTAKDSLELLRRAIAFHDPTRAYFWVRSGCHDVLGMDEQAENDRQQWKATPAKLAFDYFLPGYSQGSYGDREEAIRACEDALQLEPNHFNSLFFLAFRLGEHGKDDQAIGYYRACLALRPDHVPSLRILAGILSGQGRYSDAMALIDKACKLAPTAIQLNARAGIYEAQGKRHLALEELDRAIEVGNSDDKGLGSAHFSRGCILRNLGRHDEAIIALTKAIELRSNTYPGAVYITRAECFYAQGQREEALADADQAVKAVAGSHYQAPQHFRRSIYFNRGVVNQDLGNYRRALSDYLKAIDIDPGNSAAYQEAANLLLNCPDQQVRDPAKALRLAKKAAEIDPDDGGVHGLLGLAQYRTSDFTSAIDSCTRALECKGDFERPSVLLTFAMAHWRMEHEDEAKAWFEKAVEARDQLSNGQEASDPTEDLGIREMNARFAEAKQLLGVTQNLPQDDVEPRVRNHSVPNAATPE